MAACLDLLAKELQTAHAMSDTKRRKKQAKKVMDVASHFLFSERSLLARRGSEQGETSRLQPVPITCLQDLFLAVMPIVEGEAHTNAKNRSYGIEDGLKPAARLCGLIVACVNLSAESNEQGAALKAMLDGVKRKIDSLAKGGKDQLIPAMQEFCNGSSWLAKLCYSNCVRFQNTAPPFKGSLLEIHLRYLDPPPPPSPEPPFLPLVWSVS